nr:MULTISPECIES: hypothetical protein [unclassified Streptomyces]
MVPAALCLAAAAFTAVHVLKQPTVLVFAAGLARWAVYLAAGGPA